MYRIGKSTETESGLIVAMEWGREKFKLTASGCGVSFVGYGNILELVAQYSEYTKKNIKMYTLKW